MIYGEQRGTRTPDPPTCRAGLLAHTVDDMTNSANRERQVFDPDSIRTALEMDLPSGLRALADAIEAKEIDGAVTSVMGSALLQHWRDMRMHVYVTIDIAALAFRWSKPVDGEKIPLDHVPTIELPISATQRTSRIIQD
jgi:hypothetical protein